MKHQHLLTQLLPPVSYDRKGKRLSSEIYAEGKSLDKVASHADIVIDGITPFNVVDLLPDWERICGITPEKGANRSQRIDAVLAKLRETGGLSIPYFISLAARLGYEIEIIEFQPFYVDYSHVDFDRIYDEDVIWIWQVNITGGQVRSFPFYVDSSSVDEHLLDFSDAVIENYINDLKPAFTAVVFDYSLGE